MLTRDYKAPEFRVQDTRTTPNTQVAQGAAAGQTVSIGDDGWRDKMLADLAGKGAQLLEKAADIEYGNLYLEGQAAAGVIESEDEIQGNPLTRDWKVAGYRDTMGKLALADSEAKFAADIGDLRGKGSEELQGYLAKRRAEIMPGLASMSREARAAGMGQLLLQDRAATKTWQVEHTKFITEQIVQGVHTQIGVSLNSLGVAQTQFRMGDTSQEKFTENLRGVAGIVQGSVWDNARLADNDKRQLTTEIVANALENDSTELYDYLANNEMAGGGSMLDRLDGKQRQQLASSYRSAKTRTNDKRNLGDLFAIEIVKGQLKAGNYKGTGDELRDYLEQYVQRDVISGAEAAAIIGTYASESLKLDESSAKAQYLLNGDEPGMFNKGWTPEDGMDGLNAMMARNKVGVVPRMETYFQVGRKWGAVGYEQVGQMLGPVVQHARNSKGIISEDSRNLFTQIRDRVRQAKADGNPNALSQVLSGLPEKDRTFTNRVINYNDSGMTLEQAVAEAADLEAKESAMTPSARNAAAAATLKVASAGIMELEPMNALEAVWNKVKSFVSTDAKSKAVLMPRSEIGFRDGWFSDNSTVKMYAQTVREAGIEEVGSILDLNPFLDPGDAQTQALANVARRTVQTRHGPIVLPKGADPAKFFGVGPGNMAMVGPALDKMLTETKADARWLIKHTHNGVFAQEIDRNGKLIGNGNYLKPTDVARAVDALVTENARKADAVYGGGVEVGKSGAKIRYNGHSSSGAPPTWMLGFRNNLVEQEGVTTRADIDLSGRKDMQGNPIRTVGIGVSSNNPYYPKPDKDGNVSPEAVRLSFIKASEDAAKAGMQYTEGLGVKKLQNEHTFALMSELAYQSGVSFAYAKDKNGRFTRGAMKYQEFLAAMKLGDKEQAKAAFKNTLAWYYSVDPKKRDTPAGKVEMTKRRKHYLTLIDKAFQGV